MNIKKISFFTAVIVVVGFLIGIYSGLYKSWDEKRNPKKNQTQEIKIGGDFELIDQNGNQFSLEKNLKTKYALIFFGYSKCPTVCPKVLSNIFAGIQENKEILKKFQPIFISLDPKKDSSEELKEFSKNFEDKIIMLTSDSDQSDEIIKKIANNYKVYYTKNKETNEIDHSSIIYIVNKKGDYEGHVSASSPEEFLFGLKKFLQ